MVAGHATNTSRITNATCGALAEEKFMYTDFRGDIASLQTIFSAHPSTTDLHSVFGGGTITQRLQLDWLGPRGPKGARYTSMCDRFDRHGNDLIAHSC